MGLPLDLPTAKKSQHSAFPSSQINSSKFGTNLAALTSIQANTDAGLQPAGFAVPLPPFSDEANFSAGSASNTPQNQ
ncbi:hypothetical protein [Lysobacter gummosus]|uniref:hypothetical protein n=1 Tax=Lysobacter gummosus TaxID=262324 RepID=UPI00362E2AF1